jgi:hypothetical protein
MTHQKRKTPAGAEDCREPTDFVPVHTIQGAPCGENLPPFMEQVKDFYRFRCEDVTVQICFTKGGPPFDAALINYVLSIRQGRGKGRAR